MDGFSTRCICSRVCSISCGLLFGGVLFLSGVLVARATGPQHLDDVTPTEIPCSWLQTYRQHKDHTRFLWIIPRYEGVNITSNRTFCEEMMRLRDEEGFVLGMHGVDHGFSDDGEQEFEDLPDDEVRAKLALGVSIWMDAFKGAAPRHFSFPGEWATHFTVRLLQDEYRMQVRTLANGLLNKLYHCDDSFCETFCKAWFQDMF